MKAGAIRMEGHDVGFDVLDLQSRQEFNQFVPRVERHQRGNVRSDDANVVRACAGQAKILVIDIPLHPP